MLRLRSTVVLSIALSIVAVCWDMAVKTEGLQTTLDAGDMGAVIPVSGPALSESDAQAFIGIGNHKRRTNFKPKPKLKQRMKAGKVKFTKRAPAKQKVASKKARMKAAAWKKKSTKIRKTSKAKAKKILKIRPQRQRQKVKKGKLKQKKKPVRKSKISAFFKKLQKQQRKKRKHGKKSNDWDGVPLGEAGKGNAVPKMKEQDNSNGNGRGGPSYNPPQLQGPAPKAVPSQSGPPQSSPPVVKFDDDDDEPPADETGRDADPPADSDSPPGESGGNDGD
jgi:hypothetical protein